MKSLAATTMQSATISKSDKAIDGESKKLQKYSCIESETGKLIAHTNLSNINSI